MYEQEWHQEMIERHLRAARLIKFGISYLDDALVGILPNDFIVVGAHTGKGKTELAASIAFNASKQGKAVTLFALEADRWELHSRMRYRQLRRLYEEHYAGHAIPFQFPRYSEWLSAGFTREWDALEQEAQRELGPAMANLTIRYSNQKYSATDFISDMNELGDEPDLIIVDHLHYFDLGDRETEGIKRVVHTIRERGMFHNKPVILLAHLRKGDRKSEKQTPDLDDFHGHSDITKVATSVLLLSPVPKEKIIIPGKFPTYFHIAKSRRAAEVTPFAGIMGFDTFKNNYSSNYSLTKTSLYADPEYITDPDDIPKWAANAVMPVKQINSVPTFKQKYRERNRDD